MYFMASDVKMATQYAVENNNPQSFKNISQEPALVEENFSSRNVNPEYISRYQATENATTPEDGVVYFDEGVQQQTATGNINAYDNYTASNGGSGSNSPNVNFNFGLGFGYSPYGWGMSPYMGINYGWGMMPGLSIGIGIGMGWGYPMYPGYGWGYPMYPGYGWGYPMYGYGYPVYPTYPIYPGYPSYILPGGEYGSRQVVYGARPTRGSSITNTGIRVSEAGVMPGTARAEARKSPNAVNSSARRLVASENSRVATRDFSSSQNDYYNSSRSRTTTTTKNTNSAASDRAASTRSRSAIPSARPSAVGSPGNDIRNYANPSRSSNPNYNTRTSSPSYNRGTVPSYNRSTSPSYNNRTTTSPSYNRSVAPTRSNDNTSTFSSPSRTSTGGGSSFATPSRSSGGSSGGSVGGSRGGRGN